MVVRQDEFDNPFKLPPDDQIFLIREEERKRRALEREEVKHQRVWEKTTAASRNFGKLKRRQLDDDILPPLDSELAPAQVPRRSASDTSLGFGSRSRREKENVADFVAKKREMFLVQMSLDVKKAEIQKLDERAKQKEEALKKSQQLLDEDVARFDAFLQHNDQKAHKAMKTAEMTTKKKQDKIQQIKMIRTQLAALQSEITKHREMKDECLKYKDFLVKLTPQEFKIKMADEKVQRKANRKKAWVDRKLAENEKKMQEEFAIEEKAVDEKYGEQVARARRKPRADEEAEKQRQSELEARRRKIRRRYPDRKHFENEYEEVSSGEEMPLFFQEPKQLLDVFVALEERNLHLIQNSQDTEQDLEAITQRFDKFKSATTAKTEKMKQSITALERQIHEEENKIEDLRQKLSQKYGGCEQDLFMKELLNKTMEVNAACGHESEHDPDTIKMLRAIEAKLEEHLSAIDEAERDGLAGLVDKLERECDKQRRAKAQAARKEFVDRKSEERLQSSLQRSQAPIHRKTGKQIMFRSAPLLRMRKTYVEDDTYEQALHEHKSFGVWLGKDGMPNSDPPIKPQE